MSQTATVSPDLSAKQRRLLELMRLQKRQQEQEKGAQSTVIPRRDPTQPLVLSFGQKRLWFIEQLQPGNAAYNVPGGVRLRGAVDRQALCGSLVEVSRQHEILRTVFHSQAGEPVAVVSPHSILNLQEVDLRRVPEAEREAVLSREVLVAHEIPFDMERGPLARTVLFQLGEEEFVFLLVLHHIICDIWSVGVFFRAMIASYAALAQGRPSLLPELPIQYADYAAWQQQVLHGDSRQGLLSYWKKELTGAPFVIELPTDHPRPREQSFRGAREYLQFSVETSERLKTLGRQSDTSLYMTLLSLLMLLLYRQTGQHSILVGVPMANRNRLELENLIGLLFNTLVLRGDFSHGMTFLDLQAQIRERILTSFNHQDLPFETLVEELQVERDMSRNPIFQVLFAFQNVPPSAMAAHSLELSRYEVLEATSREDMELDMRETPEGLAGWFGFDTALFDPSTFVRTAGHFRRLVEGVLKNPAERLTELPMLAASELHQLGSEWNDTEASIVAEGREDTLIDLFRAQVGKTPGAPAVSCGAESASYADLDERSTRAAVQMRSAGVERGVLVALLAERSIDFLTAMLAVWKAGGAYLPLDPLHPTERYVQVLGQSAAPLVLVEPAFRETLGEAVQALAAAGRPVPQVLDLAELLMLSTAPSLEVSPSATLDDLAYIIYTSGSTGRPKGAMLEHGGMLNHLWAKINDLGIQANDVVAQTASQCFDISVWQFLAALMVGGRVEIFVDEIAHDPGRLLEASEARGVSVLETVPSIQRLMIEEAARRRDARPPLTTLRFLVPTGEALPPDVLETWFEQYPEVPLVNAYGPTECSDDVTHFAIHRASRERPARVSIGRPVRNVRLYVVDRHLHPTALGVSGELCVGGPAVGRGYLNDPARTAEVFVPGPHAVGARLYRTGDRVRYLADGRIDFLGRIDHQVKVRGFRIELGEIDTVLGQREEVREAVTLAVDDGAGGKALASYVVPARKEDDREALDATLRTALKELLPEYMVPAVLFFLDQLPTTPNGKIDRRALEANGVEVTSKVAYVPPRNPVEETLVDIWSAVLGREKVGVEDNFFEIGGQSLLGTQVISRIRESFEIEVPVRMIFQEPTITGLSSYLEEALLRGERQADAPPMKRLPRTGESLPASFAQERLWFIDQIRPGLPAYNIFGAVRMRGTLDLAVLERSFFTLQSRHETLRTRLVPQDGRPMQVIEPPRHRPIPGVDLMALPAALREPLALRLGNEEAALAFDLEKGPLTRALLIRLDTKDHLLAVTTHHVVYDMWSREIFIRELGVLYEAFVLGRPSPLPPLPFQYADFAAWQREWFQGKVLEEQADFWREQLRGIDTGTELPTDRPRPSVQSVRGDRTFLHFPSHLTQALKEFSQLHGVTLFMTLMAAFDTLLYRYTRDRELVVGTPIANRNRGEIESILGFFANTLVLRVPVPASGTFPDLLETVRKVAVGAYSHQDLAFEQLVGELNPRRDASRGAFFQIMFNLLSNYKPVDMELPGLSLTPEQVQSGAVPFDMILSLYEQDGQLHGVSDFNIDLFDVRTMDRLLGQYVHLLEGIVVDGDRSLMDLPLLSSAQEHQLLVEWNDSAAATPTEQTLWELFHAQVVRSPDAPAVVCEDRELTYRGLAEDAERLALHLAALGVGAEGLVAILGHRGIEFLTSILGTFRAGGAYLPLDIQHPIERLRQIVTSSQARVLLVTRAYSGPLVETLVEQIGDGVELRVIEDLLEQSPPALPAGTLAAGSPGNLAYVIYTSGSTGVPKGAMLEQRGMVNHLFLKIDDLSLGADDVVAQTASQCFDISVWQFLAALVVGGRTQVFPDEVSHDPPRLLRAVEEAGVTVLESVPSLMQLMLSDTAQEEAPELTDLRVMVPTGEALPPVLCRRWFERYPEIPLVNAYGPTECSDDVTHRTLRQALDPGRASTPIGRPMSNLRLWVVGDDFQLAPVGAPGELCVGGIGVGRGYLGDPRRSAEVFVPDPFSHQPGARFYRTRDLARWLADGELEFLGRIDHQVKIRGFRIELGEIEAALLSHPAIRESAVLVRDGEDGGRLVAYAVAAEEVEPAVLRGFLEQSLPSYMVPTTFVFLEAMPLTANGKLDRRALEENEGDELTSDTPFVEPQGEVEIRIAAIWVELLGVERVGAHDNFFDLGGHSLLTTQLMSRLRKTFDMEVPLQTFFEDPTLKGLAEGIEMARWADEVALEAQNRSEVDDQEDLEEGEI